MYSICQINFENEEQIIGSVLDTNNFVTSMNDYLYNIYPDYIYLESETMNSLGDNPKYDSNIYLLKNSNVLQLVHKIKKINEGYLWNSNITDVKLLFTWKLIPQNKLIKNKPGYIKDIQEFDFEKIKKNPSFLITAKRGTGKSWLVRDFINKLNILSNMDDFMENILIISRFDRMTSFYSIYFPKAKIVYDYDYELIKQHLNNNKGCLVLDDCIFSGQKNVLEFNVSECNIPVIITTQVPNWLCKNYAYEVDYYVFLKEDSNICKENIWFANRNIFSELDDLIVVMDSLTRNYGAMIITNPNKYDNEDKNIVDNIFSYIAQ
jgi:hypothetical protein